ncbi:MAG TPA: hypothetical protein DCE33_01595 [Rhodospirillaceae bacterium]|nr:hypothetical protein [Rhodospirillaceae bacterium]
MKPIGALVNAARAFALQPPKPASPDAEGENNKGGLERIRNALAGDTQRSARTRAADALGDAHTRHAADRQEAADRQADARKKKAFRARVARAVERIEIRSEQRVSRLESAIENGRLDPARLQSRLEARFGDRAEGIVSEDGELDRARLKELFARVGLRHLRERIDALRENRDPNTEPALAPEAVPEPGSVLSVEA